MRIAMRFIAAAALLGAAVGTTSCAEKLEGPAPGIENPTAGSLPVDPGIVCRIQHPDGGTALSMSGTNFSPLGYDIPNDPKAGLPSVALSRSAAVDGGSADAASVAYDGLSGGTNSELLTWTDTGAMTFAITDALGFEEGIYDVTVTNADGQTATSAGALAVVDRPTPTAITPGLICLAEADRALTIAGTTFLQIEGATPMIAVGDADPLPVDSLGDCVAIAHEGVSAETCGTIEFTVPMDYVGEGAHPIVITNPETAACTSVHDEDSIELVVVGPPVIESAEPASLCSNETTPTAVTFSGANFIRADGTDFAVTINGASVTPDSIDGCTTIEVDGVDAENCTSFTVTIDPTAVPEGTVEVGITNPESVGCGYTTNMVFTILGPPVITSVEPPNICSGVAEQITINGENFGTNATVFIGTTEASSVDVQSANVIVATFADGVAEGSYDVTVDNGGGCATTLAAGITVDPTPIVFFVDPPVIYNGVSFEVTIFTSGLMEQALAVELIDSNGQVTPLTAFQSPIRPNRILATVPSGLTPGDYEVAVTSQNGCSSEFNGSLTITDNLALNLTAVSPSFASPTVDTAVTIKTNAPPDFVSTPRAYLNPNPAMANVTATALSATVFVDNETLTSVVPGGLAPGNYDLIVVNPTGEVGFLSPGIVVTANEPPAIDTVTPQTFANNTDYDAVVAGVNFDAAGVTVELDCEAPDGTRTQYQTVEGNTTATSVSTTLPTSQLSKGTVCLVILTNDAEQTSFAYSAISITNSSFNLEPWTPSTAMTTGRRALSLEAGRPTRTSRFLYAVGGDDGANGGAFDSVESSSVDVFGDLGNWALQRNPLPAPRTFAGIDRIGRFLYLVGGHDGTSATDTVLRAQILDPLAGPDIIDVDAALGDGMSGQAGGLWMYRVAAVFPGTDPSNPNGESLSGEVQVVDLPDIPDRILLTITWEAVPGASGYRVYRSPMAGASFDELALVAEVMDGATVSWTDDGASADIAQTPLPNGSTGTWHQVGTLNAAREAHAVAAAPVPGTGGAQYAIYAFGGRSDTGTTHNSVEYAIVDVAADGTQTVGAWTTAAGTLDAAKAEVKAFKVTSSDTVAVPSGEDWIYVGPGRNGAAFIDGLEAFEVSMTGEPAFFSVNRPVSTDRAGYCAGASNGFLYVFGGAGGNAGDGGISAEMCNAVRPQCQNVPPDLQSGAWNSLGISMSTPRLFCDVAQESAFYFVAGGTDGTAPVTNVDQTVQ